MRGDTRAAPRSRSGSAGLLVCEAPVTSIKEGLRGRGVRNLKEDQHMVQAQENNDPDFLSTVVEQRNFAKMTAGSSEEKASSFFSEKISLRCGGEKWTVPRHRLTPAFLQEAVNRNRVGDHLPPLVVQYLRDKTTNTVVSPSDAPTHCRSGGDVCYDIVSSSAGSVVDGGVLASEGEVYYNGDVAFLLSGIPEHSADGSHLTVVDVNRWLVDGAIASLDPVRILVDQQNGLRRALTELEREKGQVHSRPVLEEKEKRLVQTTRALGEVKAKHYRHCKLEMRKLETGNSYEVKVKGGKKLYYTTLITDQKGWSLVPLFATGQAKGAQKKCSLVLDTEAAQHSVVDLRRAFKIERLPDGFGVLEMYSSGNAQQILFNGHFLGGHYLDGTLRTDAFTFQGLFRNGQPSKGRCSYADGTVVEGEFALSEARRVQSQLGPDYRRTLPKGKVDIQFKGGKAYSCTMKNGRACRETDIAEEPPKLHRSIMFRGERLYFDTKSRASTTGSLQEDA